MIPRFSPDYRWKDLVQCFLPAQESNVSQLERVFAERAGAQAAVAFKYGRSGLFYLLKALGIQNKKVIMPSYTCVVVAHAVVLSGNQPVFLDNAPNSFQPLPDAYLRAIEEQGPEQVAMVIPTHLFGVAEETEALYRTVKARYPHVFVLQDCAHGYFAEDSTEKSVTNWGDGAIFGMNISKLVNSVRGGMLTLKDPALAQKVKTCFREERQNQNMDCLLDSLKARLYVLAAGLAFIPLLYEAVYWLTHHTAVLSGETDYYNEASVELPADFWKPMLSFEAGIGLNSLDRYTARIQARQEIAHYYIERLQALPGVVLPTWKPGNTWSHFPVLVDPAVRRAAKKTLESQLGVEIGVIVDYAVSDLAAYREKGHPSCPIAYGTVPGMLNLPLTFRENLFPVDDWQGKADQVIEAIKQACGS